MDEFKSYGSLEQVTLQEDLKGCWGKPRGFWGRGFWAESTAQAKVLRQTESRRSQKARVAAERSRGGG